MSTSIPIVLLAAGGSTRLGRPKQLVRLGSQSLLRRAAEEALATGCEPVVVVLGSEAQAMEEELAGLTVEACHNEAWSEGIASSIRAGLRHCLDREPDVPAVLIMLCDQPAIDRSVLADLLRLHAQSPVAATACAVNERAGAPAIFDRSLFEELLALRGDQGAREILRRDSLDMARLEFPAAAVDVDTPEDVEALD